MADRRYRCRLCVTAEWPFGLEFENAEPVCPRCKVGGDTVVPLVRVHYYAADPRGPIGGSFGRLRLACAPGEANPKGLPATGEPTAVTCEACKKTKEYQAAAEAWGATRGGIVLE
jgi:hypothetical protein